MKNKKTLLALIGMILFALLITGCAKSVKTEEQIATDLSRSEYLPADGLQINEIDILQRRTDAKNGTDLVYVNARGAAGKIKYQFSYILDYLYFDQGGWILQSVEPYKTENWMLDPVDDNEVQQDILENDWGILYGVDIISCDRFSESIFPQSGSCTKTLRIEGQGQGYHCDATVQVSYQITTDGWKYINHYYENKIAYPEYSASAAAAETYVQSIYGFPSEEASVDTEWDYARETHYVVSREILNYLTIAKSVEIDYSFDADTLSWIIDDYHEIAENYIWDVAGTWYAEGVAESDTLYPKGFKYMVKCRVTPIDEQSFQVDYEYLNPIVPWTSRSGTKQDDIGAGTVYVDVNKTYRTTKNGMWDITPEWRLETDLPGSEEFLLFSADKGVSITHWSWGGYTKTLIRTN